MDSRKTAIKTLAQKWRAHCRSQAERFASLGESATIRRHRDRLEEQCIERMLRDELPLGERAAAFRTVWDLRGCTVRDVHDFFTSLDPKVVAAALSLLQLPLAQSAHAVPPAPLSAVVPQQSPAIDASRQSAGA